MDIVILAAGEGRRFGGCVHKSLAPLLFGLGTLPLLLRQLRRMGPGGRVCVVTGHKAEDVTRAVREQMPSALCVPAGGTGPGSVLHSLAAGLSPLDAAGDGGALVLFADSHYQPDSLARMLALAGDAIAVAAEPWRADADHPVGLCVEGNRIVALGPDAVAAPWMMAPALYWPRQHWPALQRAAAAGQRTQWQALRSLLRAGDDADMRIVPVATGDIADIDSPADLEALRTRLLGAETMDYFRANLSKDERTLPHPDSLRGGHFLKACRDGAEAAHEYAVLDWLHSQPGEALVPTPQRLAGRHLIQQHIQGIRLFDLLQVLRPMAQGTDQPAAAAVQTGTVLLGRSLARLGRVQQALQAWPGAQDLPAYPMDSHVRDLLAVLLHLLQLPPLGGGALRDLAAIREIWVAQDARVPFRDATPKNILVAVPDLAPHRWHRRRDRRAAILTWMQQPGAAEQVALYDFDFTSTRHLTAPEDDLISLLGHRGSMDFAARLRRQDDAHWLDWLRSPPPALMPAGMVPDRERAARALLVRHLRFGGRKLAYRILNPAGYAVRFCQDDPAPYFRDLPAGLQALDPGFARRWPDLSAVLAALAAAVAGLPAWHPRETAQDAYLAALHRPVDYWRESPLERMGASV